MDYPYQYRRLRNGLAWAIGVAWIVWWYGHLHQQYEVAMAALQNCDGLGMGSLSDAALKLKCKAGRLLDSGSASNSFYGGMAGAVVTAPLAWIVARYIARGVIERRQAADEKRDATMTAVREREEEAQRAKRITHAENAARFTRQSIDRSEFIHKLGSVSDLLDLLPTETDSHRIAIIRQTIAKELRDLVAKHTLPELVGLIRSDETIRLSLSDLLGRLAAAGQRLADAQILQMTLERSTTENS